MNRKLSLNNSQFTL